MSGRPSQWNWLQPFITAVLRGRVRAPKTATTTSVISFKPATDVYRQRHASSSTSAPQPPQPPQPPHGASVHKCCFSVRPLLKTLAVSVLMDAERASGAAKRRRERLLRSMLRHERQTVAMEVAAALHHSRETYLAYGHRRQPAQGDGPVS